MLAGQVVESWLPSTDAEKQAVQEQLERVIRSSYFSHSKRFPSFLQFVVSHALSGNADVLKERTLGVEVFGRKPDYDTTVDPIVRVTAAEIRKRIAQYYLEPGHEDEIRLLLPPGTYAPHFYLPVSRLVPAQPEIVAAPPLPEALSPVPPVTADVIAARPARRAYLLPGLALLAILLVIAAFVGRGLERNSPFIGFWQPLIDAKSPVLFCIADQNQNAAIALRDASNPVHQNILADHVITVVIDDINPLVKLAGLIESHGIEYHLKGEEATTLTDLRQGPNILIGAYDNAWTLRLTNPLRFHFANNPQMTRFWIEDRDAPGKQLWFVDRNQQQTTNIYKDYAIVARFVDQADTGHFAVIDAGIGSGGTIAGGEFLTEPRYLDELMRRAPRDWKNRNMEAVLETQIIDGRSGTPHVVAVYFW